MSEQGIDTDHRSLGKESGAGRCNLKGADIFGVHTEEGDTGGGQKERTDDQGANRHLLGQNPHQEGSSQTTDIDPDQNPTGEWRRIAHVDDNLWYPFKEEVMGHHMSKVSNNQSQGHETKFPGKQQPIRFLLFRCSGLDFRQLANLRLVHTLESLVDLLKSTEWTLGSQITNRLRQQEERQNKTGQSGKPAKNEDGVPAVGDHQFRRDHATDNNTQRESAGHEQNGRMLAALIGVFGNQGVDGSDQATDSQSSNKTEQGQRIDAGRHSRSEHAGTDNNKTAKNQWPATEFVSQPAADNRTERHTDQFHRQNDTKSGTRNPPIRSDSRGRKCNGKNVKTIKSIE